MFIVTSDGVIATDPLPTAGRRAARPYVSKSARSGPADQVADLQATTTTTTSPASRLQDAGARILAHKRAKERLAQIRTRTRRCQTKPWTEQVPHPGGTTIESHVPGLNHSDSTLVMRLPRERLIFVVDLIPVGGVPGRHIDFYRSKRRTPSANPGRDWIA